MVSVLTLGLASCQQIDGEAPDGLVSNEMSFNITSPNGQTRVSNGAFEIADEIGVWVTDYVDASTPMPLQISGNRANNEVLTFDGAAWNTERTIYWGEGKSDVYAYYPYIADIAMVEDMPFSVATDQDIEGAYEASDLLWAKATGVSQNDGAVSLNMQHTMSRLVVKIMAGEEYVGSLPKDATIHLHSTVADTRVTLATGSVVKDPYAGVKSIKMRNLGVRSFAEGEAVVYEAIVVPQMLVGRVPLLEINSKSVSYLLEDTFNFKPGTSYTYTAVLNTSTTAIKVEIGCEIEDWNNIGGGSGSEDGGEGGEGSNLAKYTDLSAEGTANCYTISEAGDYRFKTLKGNTNETVGNVKQVEVLWETFGTDEKPNVGDLIAEATYENGYVCFSTPETFKNGNASIAVRNSKGVILWSWHIWFTEEGWIDHVYANNAGTMMDRHLGATSATPGNVGAFGLLYQWGRKDPFVGSCATSGSTFAASTGNWDTVSGGKSVSFAEQNPTKFVIESFDWCSQRDGDYAALRWYNDKKSPWDPCPYGYRVPNGGNDSFWAIALGTSAETAEDERIKWDDTYCGNYWTLADGETTAWYPATGNRSCSDGLLESVGSFGHCWSACLGPSNSWDAYELSFLGGCVSPSSHTLCGRGISVRCVKER